MFVITTSRGGLGGALAVSALMLAVRWHAVDTIVSCGSCHWCQRGEVTRCPALGALGLHGDGGLAELCNAPGGAG
jgi:D-arabinose 1-dehydrogenase-like Zn-dependent alcohol dehydrogenase